MQVELIERDGVRIVECVGPIARVGDALELVAACVERDATRVLLESRHLPPAFFELRSGFAGELLQKLQNYRLRLAGVFPQDADYGERFREFLLEARRGRSFRVFAARAEAEAWLASD
jgi:Domain of unknown function (DUF4180)